jgi:hypothetical protein
MPEGSIEVLNVTKQDHKNESAILSELTDHGFSLVRHFTDDLKNTLDAEIVSETGNSVLAELRTRSRYSGEALNGYGGVYLNVDKFWSAVKIARNAGKLYGFFVACSDGLWSAKLYDPSWTDEQFLDSVVYAITNPKRVKERDQSANDSCFAYNIKIGKIA